MANKITTKMKRAIRGELARLGGKARAAKYSHEQLSEWARRGGRPRKGTKAQGKQSASSREKGREK
jgi:hypothetical protein